MPVLYPKPPPPSDDKRWKIVETRMRRMGDRPAALIEALHAAQEAFGYLDTDALHYVGDTLGVPHSRVYGVATFYSFFTLKPQGEHTCVVCTGHGLLHQRRQGHPGRPRTRARRQAQADDRGREGLAPDRALPGRVQPGAGRHRRRRGQGQGQRGRPGRPAGGDVSEQPAAARPIRRRVITEEVHEGPVRATRVRVRGGQLHVGPGPRRSRCAWASARRKPASATSMVKRVGCLGLCAAGPLVEIPETGQLFDHVRPDDVDGIVEALKAVKPTDDAQPQGPFFEKQLRVATENMGRIDPESLDDYVARGGYEALRTVLSEMTSTEVRDEITRSGLRGRGGAGFPTGLKWTTVAKAQGTQKYVICNADEGDPGAFMDRSVLESDPYRVLEGMAIAAFAVHATEGYIYCRAEYPLAVARLRTAIRQAQRAG